MSTTRLVPLFLWLLPLTQLLLPFSSPLFSRLAIIAAVHVSWAMARLRQTMRLLGLAGPRLGTQLHT